MDTTQDGVLEPHEIREALKLAGVNPTKEEVCLLIDQLDINNNGAVEFSEFRRVFLLCPEMGVRNVFETWRRAVDAGIDKGEVSYSVPDSGNAAWKILVAGGIAGGISRTATAPFDRLKVLLQAGGKVSGKEITGIVSGLSEPFSCLPQVPHPLP